MKIIDSIQNDVRHTIGDFEYELIYMNSLEMNHVYLLTTKTKKFILKIKNNNADPTEEIKQEINGRQELKAAFDKAGIDKYFITKVVRYDLKNLWVLFDYAEFETLYSIFKQDQKKFKKIIMLFYQEIILPLYKYSNHNVVKPGDFGLNDIGYANGIFYFYDLESNKELLGAMVDMYAKLIHLRFLQIKKNELSKAAFVHKLIMKVKKYQKQAISNKEKFNIYLENKLKSRTLANLLPVEKVSQVFEEYGY